MVITEKEIKFRIRVRGYSQQAIDDRIAELEDRLFWSLPKTFIRAAPSAPSEDRRPVDILHVERNV